MPLHKRLLLPLLLAGSLNAARLTLDLVWNPFGYCCDVVIDGPRGTERYELQTTIDAVHALAQNDRWQVVLVTEREVNPPQWHAFNYGRGHGEYFAGSWDGSAGRLPFLFRSPEDVPGFTYPEGFSGGHWSWYGSRFRGFDELGRLKGDAYFDEVWFDPTPDDPFNEDGSFVLPAFVVPFAYDLGANPYFTPEPGSLLLVGLGLFGVWRVRRAWRI